MTGRRKREKLLLTTAATVLVMACGPGTSKELVSGDAAQRVYVAPGEHDELYAFMSGGFSGNMTVYGLPSGRLLKTIPVFSQFPESGWGYSEETKPMLQTSYGMIPWDDAHHPQLSRTGGTADGRWIFINGNNTPRIARIDLSTFETTEILEIPHTSGGHASPFITPNTEYAVSAIRFSLPVPNADVPISSYKENFKGSFTFVRADQPGKMDVAFQIMLPAYDFDIGRAGKAKSDGWFFATTYNTEEAYTLLELNASKNDKDFIAAINWKRAEACVAEGKTREIPATYYHNVFDEATRTATSEVKHSVKTLTPADCEGMVYFLPTPKSPHGVDVDPSGEYIVGAGKLATVIPVHSFSKMLEAIEKRDFDGEAGGIPVLRYEAVLAGEVEKPGLGPLHTEFDGKGNAYTSMFISSEIVKWKLGTWEILDRIPVYYSIGHLMIPGGDEVNPYGKYVVALNKITKDRYLPTGPELTQSAQLIDITGDKMRMLLDFPTQGEPHYAQAIPADKIKNQSVKLFSLADSKHPWVARDEATSGISRNGNKVHIKLIALRSHFTPDVLEGVEVGDTVYWHVTNIEQDWDVLHGFAVMGMRTAELILRPGETQTMAWVPQKPGIYPFYCTDFCSALHQEMQGYIRVSAKGAGVPLKAGVSAYAAQQSAAQQVASSNPTGGQPAAPDGMER